MSQTVMHNASKEWKGGRGYEAHVDAIINRDDSELRAAVDNLLRKCATVSMFDSRLLLRPLLITITGRVRRRVTLSFKTIR